MIRPRWNLRLRNVLLGGALVAALSVSGPPPLLGSAEAQPSHTYTVNVLNVDQVDQTTTDSVCDTNTAPGSPGDQCTLRAAVIQSNARAGVQTIVIPSTPAPGITLTIPGAGGDTQGDLDITAEVIITGAGPTASIVTNNTNPKDRVMDITGGAVSISGLAIRNGGNVTEGGGIRSDSATTLSNVALSQNTATNRGGAIKADDALTLTNSNVTSNTSAGDGGGIYSEGPSLQITGSTIQSNTASTDGGGLHVENIVKTTITSSTFAQNGARIGGGIYAEGALDLTGSTISSNSATMIGGGLAVQAATNLQNVTVSGNSAPSAAGIHAFGNTTATLTLDHTTIAFNQGGGITQAATGGGVAGVGGMAVRPRASIISNNTPQNCVIGNAPTWISQGYNVANDASCSLTGTGDKPSQDPRLSPLALTGGTTQTHELQPGSAALEAVTASCPPPGSDQRGVARPQDVDKNGSVLCDSGAVEMLAPASIASSISLAPTSASVSQGGTHPLTANVRDQFNNPFPSGIVVWSVAGANVASGQGATGADGNFSFSYAGPNAGQDTVTAFADRNADGVQQPDEPQATASVTWGPPPAPECQGNPGATCGTTGDDVIVGTEGDDLIITGDGNDTIDCGAGGNDTVLSGAGNDKVTCGEGDDDIDGGDGDDVIDCGTGNDDADGGLGNDQIDCGDGVDVILGGEGDDVIDCGDDNDSADGGAGNDTITGGAGDDSLQGGEGADNVSGQGGNDLVVGDPSGASVRPVLTQQTQTASNDTLDGGDGKDTVLGRSGPDKAFGGAGNDYVDGDFGNDSLEGSAGDDAVRGDEGNDKLKGGPGKDGLEGNEGKNGYDGGPGTDTCYLAEGKNDLKSCEKKKTTMKRNNM